MKRFQIKINLLLSFVLLFAASLAIAVFLLIIQPNANTRTSIWPLIAESGGLFFLLNWLPVLLVLLCLFFISGRLIPACGAAALLFTLPAMVNRYMIAMRHAPLRPFDLLLGMEFLGIAKSIRPAVYIAFGMGLAAGALLFIFLVKTVKNNRPPFAARVTGFLISGGLCVILFLTLYGNTGVHSRLPVQGNPYDEINQYQSKGFLYSFLYTLRTSRVTKPAYYEQYKSAVEEAENEKKPAKIFSGKRPHIIMVLSEAFSEIPLSPFLNYEGHTDPLRHYKDIKEEALHGYIIVPNIGGGTSDTEFDILTGINTRNFRHVPYAFTMITRPFPGLAAVFQKAGYATLAIHPGAGWFYNRQNVYPWLGFARFMDDSQFDHHDRKGMYITETQTIGRVIREYQSHLDTSPEIPLFLKCVTIQNHGPYYGKYNGIKENFNTDLTLSATDKNTLANYLEGVGDCDRELRRLVEYLRASEAPAVLLYYGDHLPSLPLSLYQAFVPEPESPAPGESLRYNRLPYIIWANEAAKPFVDADAFIESLPEDKTVSAHYLGAALLEMAGLDNIDPFFDYINTLRPAYPVVLEAICKAGSSALREFDPEADPMLALYRSWAYHRISRKD